MMTSQTTVTKLTHNGQGKPLIESFEFLVQFQVKHKKSWFQRALECISYSESVYYSAQKWALKK